MQRTLVIWLIFVVLVAVFAVVNAGAVAVNLIFGQVEISLALLVVIPLLIGAGLGYAIDVPRRLKARKRLKELEQRLSQIEAEAAALRNPVEKATASKSSTETK
jgi:uncharacterized integral membrane protein